MGHSSPSIVHPFNSFSPISDDALSDCARRRRVSAVSGGGANVGELWASDISVGGVDVREVYDSDEELAGSMFCGWVSKKNHKLSIKNGLSNSKCDFLPQLAQNVVMGVLPFGDRIRGTTHPEVGQD